MTRNFDISLWNVEVQGGVQAQQKMKHTPLPSFQVWKEETIPSASKPWALKEWESFHVFISTDSIFVSL
jgi:light-regulated signal transduction histidine kinase (bacteriophytochrome)